MHDVVNNTGREYRAPIVNNDNAKRKPLDPLDALTDFSEHENISYSQTSSEFKVSNDTSSSRRPASSVYPLQSNDNGRWPGMFQQSTGKDIDMDSEGFDSQNAESPSYSGFLNQLPKSSGISDVR